MDPLNLMERRCILFDSKAGSIRSFFATLSILDLN